MTDKIFRFVHHQLMRPLTWGSVIKSILLLITLSIIRIIHPFPATLFISKLWVMHLIPFWKIVLVFSIFSLISSIALIHASRYLLKLYVMDQISTLSAFIFIILFLTIDVGVTRYLSQVVCFIWSSSGRSWFHGMHYELFPSMMNAWKNQLLIFPPSNLAMGIGKSRVHPANWVYPLIPTVVIFTFFIVSGKQEKSIVR